MMGLTPEQIGKLAFHAEKLRQENEELRDQLQRLAAANTMRCEVLASIQDTARKLQDSENEPESYWHGRMRDIEIEAGEAIKGR